MAKREKWLQVRHLHVNASVHAKLFDAAADRHMVEPDDIVSYHVGAVMDESLREHFNMGVIDDQIF